jgi:hypothetical protein
MKTKNYFFSLALILMLYGRTFAQSTPVLEYTYDLNGNRHIRHVVYILKNTPMVHDSSETGITDTSALAVNINNAINDQQNTNVNANSNAGATGMEQYAENIGDQQIIVYPNPTKGYLQVKITPFSSSIKEEINVYDIQGHLLIKETCTSELTLVDISKYATGSYIMKIRMGDRESEWRIVKQ